MKTNIDYIKEQLPDAKIMYSGDQPVYHATFKLGELSNLGKFHAKLNTLLGVHSLQYIHGISSVQKKYTASSKNLKEIPNGYYKQCESLQWNCFLLYWDMLLDIFDVFCKVQKYEKTFTYFIHFLRLGPFLKERYGPNRWYSWITAQQLIYLSNYCTNIGMSFYMYTKSIKTQSRLLYTCAIKTFFTWILQCANTSKTKYFTDLGLHLYDIYYRWSPTMTKFFFDNMAFRSVSDNIIPFDEQCEIDNKSTKPGSQSRGRSPVKKMINNCKMDNIIRFVRTCVGQVYDYKKDKLFEEVKQDLTQGYNHLKMSICELSGNTELDPTTGKLKLKSQLDDSTPPIISEPIDFTKNTASLLEKEMEKRILKWVYNVE